MRAYASEAAGQGKSSTSKQRGDGSKADDSNRASGSKRTSAEAKQDRGDAYPAQPPPYPLPAPLPSVPPRFSPSPPARTPAPPPPRACLMSLRAPPPPPPPLHRGNARSTTTSVHPRKCTRPSHRCLPSPRTDTRHAWPHGREAIASHTERLDWVMMTTRARLRKRPEGPQGRGLRPLWVRGRACACAPASAGLLRTATPVGSPGNVT